MELPDVPMNRDLTYLGIATYRDKNQLFGIKRKDRRQHVYLLGKSGTGKSVLMFNMIIQNIQNGDGVCLVDPHGENVEAVLSAIPAHRVKDVIYFNPADTDYHIGFNVLELVDPQYKHLVASGLMGIFTKIWANAWSARMEYILNNTILALLDTPGSTMLGIPRMLVDKDYRQKIIGNLKDPVIKAFWVHEYEAWQEKFRNEAIAPIQNKVGQFLSTSIIRNVVGQEKSTINIFDMMNEGKIFLVNVSKGRIGEDNSALLGGMIITKIQLAAMERVRIPEDDRKDFYLYVDEFQNFVTDAFASILSEARKYRLNLTVAHQYTAQLVSDKSTAVRDSIFGNVGTMIIFRVGSDDAEFLEKEFDPEFTPGDIVNLPNYKIYLKLMIDGITSRPFSAKTLPPMVKGGNLEIEKAVIESSRALYCKSREDVEREINNWSGMSLGDDGNNVPGNIEKFPAVCSFCKKDTTVPFKPEKGRPVYCKDCIAKIKAGEIKPNKDSIEQVRRDEAEFYRPLSDLGIEFKVPENIDLPPLPPREIKENKPKPANTFVPVPRPGMIKTIKKAFTPKFDKDSTVPKKTFNKNVENLALREVLNKTLAKQATIVQEEEKQVEPPKPALEPISLEALKSKMKDVVPVKKDKAATSDDMNKLKDLIIERTQFIQEDKVSPVKPEPEKPTPSIPPTPTPSPEEKKKEPEVTPPPQTTNPTPQAAGMSSNTNTSNTGAQKEVPEDVLRKILE